MHNISHYLLAWSSTPVLIMVIIQRCQKVCSFVNLIVLTYRIDIDLTILFDKLSSSCLLLYLTNSRTPGIRHHKQNGKCAGLIEELRSRSKVEDRTCFPYCMVSQSCPENQNKLDYLGSVYHSVGQLLF